MVVVFAGLIVVVVAAFLVFALRTPGRTHLPSVEPDGPATAVPSGPLTPEDVRAVRFPIVFRGYRPADVDALLERLAAQGREPETSP